MVVGQYEGEELETRLLSEDLDALRKAHEGHIGDVYFALAALVQALDLGLEPECTDVQLGLLGEVDVLFEVAYLYFNVAVDELALICE